MQITGKRLLLLLNIQDSELPLPSTLSRSGIFSWFDISKAMWRV